MQVLVPKSELETERAKWTERSRLYNGKRWGGWEYYATQYGPSLAFDADSRNLLYLIDLESIHSSTDMLTRIMEIVGEASATNDCIADLCRALDELFDPPDCFYYFGGRNRRIKDPAREIDALYARRAEELPGYLADLTVYGSED